MTNTLDILNRIKGDIQASPHLTSDFVDVAMIVYKSSGDPDVLRQIASKLIEAYIFSNGAADTFISILKTEVLYDLYLELGTELCVKVLCSYPEWLIKHYVTRSENDSMDLDSIEECPESPIQNLHQEFENLPLESDLHALYELWTRLITHRMPAPHSMRYDPNATLQEIGTILYKMLSQESK